MELATRVVSIERGRDPRDLTLVAFGGSGPVHGCRLAQALGIPRVILPAAAGVTAAIGLLAAEVRFDVARTYVRRLDAVEPARLRRMYAEMTRQATEVVRESAVVGEIAVARSADARYVGQGYELTVPVPWGSVDVAALGRVGAEFDDIYAARYGYANPGEPVEVVTWKLSAVGGSPRIALAKVETQDGARAVKGSRRAYFPEARGYVDAPVYDRYALAAGGGLPGPAVLGEGPARTGLAAHPVEPLRPGDAILLNDPLLGSGHLPDFFVTQPAFHAGDLVGFAVNILHHTDVGGQRPGSQGVEGIFDYFQEGLRIPPTKVWRRYEEQAGTVRILAAHTPTPGKGLRALRAQRSAFGVCEPWPAELARRDGPGT